MKANHIQCLFTGFFRQEQNFFFYFSYKNTRVSRKLILTEFRLEFRSKLILTFDKIFGRNSDTQSKWKCWFILVKNALKFRHWYWNLVPKSELRCRNRNSNSELEIRIGIPMSKSKPTKLGENFVGISISSKVKNEFRGNPNQHPDNSGKLSSVCVDLHFSPIFILGGRSKDSSFC
jgi:hypothetical protein